MKKRLFLFAIAIVLALTITSSVSWAESKNEIANLNLELSNIDGSTTSTTAAGKAKILFFFNTQCSHCLTIESDIVERGYDPEQVDIIMAESSNTPITLEKAKEFYKTCKVETSANCYGAKETCWTYLRACGYVEAGVVKPVIVYIGSDNKIKGFSTSYVDIYEKAIEYGICLEGHYWNHVTEKPKFCKDGRDYDLCIICGEIKNETTLRGLGPSGVSVTGLFKDGESITVSWKKPSAKNLKKISGYQIRYSQTADFENSKSVSVTKNSTTKKKITGLEKNKTYYLSVRTYKKLGGKKYYSQWSRTASI